MEKKRLLAAGLSVMLGMSIAGCSTPFSGNKKEETEEAAKVAVEVQNPTVGSLSTDTAYIGTITPEQQVYVIPKTSGTVTEVAVKVGDMVTAGDLLFKIDDEAAQLQLSASQAQYEQAQAGVTAQTGGARHAQNYQTEEQIRQLKKNLVDTENNIDDMEDNLGDLRDYGKVLSSGLAQAQAAQEQAVIAYNEATDAEKEDKKKLLDAANQQVASIQAAIAANQSTKTQLKSGISQAEDGKETLRDNLTMAETAYGITQNEIYPETDATYAAQLQAAAVAVDSAKMQLDFCTVTAPIGGVVESVSVEKEGMAAAGNVAAIISNKESMTVTFSVTEQAKNVLTAGDAVTVERGGVLYDGAITEIGTMANQQTKLFLVKASVANAGGSLPNGVSVRVYATTQKEEGKLVVPYDALYFSAGDAYIYCVENDVIVRKAVQVGLMSDTEAVIEEGLTKDDLIVANWSSKLRDGAEAEIVSVNGEPAEAPAEPAETPEEGEPAAETEEGTEPEEEPAEASEGEAE